MRSKSLAVIENFVRSQTKNGDECNKDGIMAEQLFARLSALRRRVRQPPERREQQSLAAVHGRDALHLRRDVRGGR